MAFIGILIQWNKTELMAQFGFKPWHVAMENPNMKWVVICANFLSLNILDVYFETDLEGTLIKISPSVRQVSAYTPEELRGIRLILLYETPERQPDLLKQLFSEGQVNGYELILRDKPGNGRVCSVNARRMRNSWGEMETLGMLAGGVTHDLNNVLSGVVTYPELLLMDLEPESPMAKSLEIIQKSGLRATEIVQDLLTLSRRGVVTRKVVDLNDIVREFVRTPEYEKILSFHPDVLAEVRYQAHAALMKGSAVHLQKTVMNLISNAAEAQPSGGRIQVTTRNIHLDSPVKGYDRVHPGDYLLLTVEDQGEGIAPEDLDRIFEPFFTKKVMGRSGTGLCMAVVWGTVQDHEGYINVASTQGKGTRFDLYFPTT